MTDFQAYSPSHVVSGIDDWNQLLDHGIEKPVRSIIRKKADGTIEAINGSTGKIEYSGTDAATVINSAIAVLTNGSRILVKAGDYTLTATLLVSSKQGIVLEGEGRHATKLTAQHADHVIKVTGSKNVTVQGFYINGNRATYSTLDGIHMGNSPFTVVQDCWIVATGRDGVRVFNASTYSKVLRNWIGGSQDSEKVGWDGVWVDGGSAFCIVAHNHVIKALYVGIELDGNSHHCIASENVVEYCGEDASDVWPGIKLYGVSGAVVIGNVIKNCYQHGIYSGVSAQNMLIASNTFNSATLKAAMTICFGLWHLPSMPRP
jgi:parallel beta-helix repeat protein